MTTYKLNRLTRSQKQERSREMQKASLTALKTYFLSNGSLQRTMRFLFVFLVNTAFWTVVATSITISALLVVLFVASDHTHLLNKMSVLLEELSIKKMDVYVVSRMASILQFGIWVGVPVGLAKALDPIVGPAKSMVVRKWQGGF